MIKENNCNKDIFSKSNVLEKKKISNSNKDKSLDKNDICCENICIKNLYNKNNYLKKKLKDKKLIILKLKNKILDLNKNLYDINLRFKADIENIYKRNDLNIEKIYKYSLKKFAKDLLPIIDSLKQSILVSKNKKIDVLINYKGLKLTLKNFLLVIKKFGIEIINSKNILFDPNYHQAVSVTKTNDVNKNNLIIEILQDGYLLNNRLLRPAMVHIYKYESSK